MQQAKGIGEDFKGITAEPPELREDGYFYQAKLIVLLNLRRENKRVALHRRGGSDAYLRQRMKRKLALKNADLERILSLLSLLEWYFKRRFTCFGES